MHFSLKQLQHLVLLADERHFARASDRAALSQSAFSRSIQALENALDVQLFDRDLKQVRPTAVGERLIERARALLADGQDLAREVALLRSGELGNVAVGAGALAGAALLPEPLAMLRQAHPAVRVDVEVVESNALLEKLLAAGLDFFVGEHGELPRHEDIRIESLGRLTLGFYCSAHHPLASRELISLADLDSYRVASVHIPQPLQLDLARRLGIQKVPELSLQCGGLSLLRDYVLSSDAVLLGADRPFRLELQQGLLVPLHIRELAKPGEANMSAWRVEMGLVYLASRTPTPSSRILMDLIRDQACQQLT